MKRPTANHHKSHKSPQWRADAWSPRARVPRPEFRYGAAVSAAAVGSRPGGHGPWCRVSALRREYLNWTLRRYVRALSLRVWLRRQAPEAGGAPVPAGGGGPLHVGRPPSGAASSAETRSSAPGGRPRGVSLSRDHALRYRMHRNRQMEHFTQVAGSLRGGVRRGAAITMRERGAARDLVLATLSNRTTV
jgi:hypothetical protein